MEYKDRDHALFVAYAPVSDPRYAISVVVEHGGSGSSAAAPIAKEVIKKVLERHELRENISQSIGKRGLMYKARSIQSSLSIKDKFFSFDFILVIAVLILGVISMFAMYSTDGGEFKYHTKSHIIRFSVFFLMFFVVSLFEIRFWHQTSTIFYISIFILLLGVKYFGLSSSGSQRWLNFYFMNLQPSELMKIALILFLAKYYHRISTNDVNKLKFLFLPIVALISPVLLVITQPDLGTSILIAIGGITVAWLAGVRVKFFIYSLILFISLMPIAISFLKPYQKARILTFFKPR